MLTIQEDSPLPQLAVNSESTERLMDKIMNTNNIPLNQIFYGPPGTGKTYATIDAALEILEPQSLELGREGRKARFDQLLASERIRFVTFHQSFSYEDFVEGLRADSDESDDGRLRYRVERGIFRGICEDSFSQPAANQSLGVGVNPRIWKISIEGTQSSQSRQYCLAHGEARIGWGHVGDLRTADLANPEHRLGTNDRSCLDAFAHEIELGDILVCIKSNTEVGAVGVVQGEYHYESNPPAGVLQDYKHVIPVRWLASGCKFSILPLNGQTRFTLKTLYELHRFSWPELMAAMLADGVELMGISESEGGQHPKKPYVLIIDEINRGNISRIFGELITLIEPSKRLGAPEELTVTLPYSKKPFGVPSNLYLIGTMNTADRSLAGLDIALRRRFTFKEMPPRPELLDGITVEGIPLGQLLRKINERIEVLLDRDHCLGHAYFMALTNDSPLSDLAAIFKNQIVPLLQEYFFEDWQRIQWVLNDHRKIEKYCFVLQKIIDEQLFGDKVVISNHNASWFINGEAFEMVEAYVGILDHQATLQSMESTGIKRQASYNNLIIKEQLSGTIEIWKSGSLQPNSIAILRDIAAALELPIHYSNGTEFNTRKLGRTILDALGAGAS